MMSIASWRSPLRLSLKLSESWFAVTPATGIESLLLRGAGGAGSTVVAVASAAGVGVTVACAGCTSVGFEVAGDGDGLGRTIITGWLGGSGGLTPMTRAAITAPQSA